MNATIRTDVLIIGGGPAGLAAACAAGLEGAATLLIEREGRLGGILKQCIHDGFGLLRYKEKLSGPEYAQRHIEEFKKSGAALRLNTFVSKAEILPGRFALTLCSPKGIERVETKTVVLSTGCRERSARQVFIHGTRPAGILSAGAAQYYTNILGQLPCRRCVILGSGDIGLIMARRLHLEGANVLGVYEAKPTPSGLTRNIAQCLEDYNLPLYTSHTVTRVFGSPRLEGVEIAQVDEAMRPIAGTEKQLSCDGLILSVGLIPENELAETLGVPLDNATRGPISDQRYMTLVPGIFSCGNALMVSDLVDYVSEIGEEAGRNAARYAAAGRDTAQRRVVPVQYDPHFLCLVPQRISLDDTKEETKKETALFFRAQKDRDKTLIRAFAGSRELFRQVFPRLRPPEMERITVKLDDSLRCAESLRFTMEDV
ncbi:MAG: NAD(P)/FAD-dependent oxidoreductase [Treponema sp.]|jgi:thioredoxin reductase|nr:NAD(P)/FAD-dependent oxidoreductase [Treponema sp.]